MKSTRQDKQLQLTKSFKNSKFKIYLVGGAVRDRLLGIENYDRDWVVVGATPKLLLDSNFKQVGKSFPVFLHPETKEEYALARKEIKSGKGYHGFRIDFSPSITLEQDLSRRDLTINAIAQDELGQIIDPYNGKVDIENKVLRHVSEAFLEDPLRVLRLARFAAKFPDFSIANETLQLAKSMCASGELSSLSHSRIWLEIEKALLTPKPSRFFLILREFGALQILFPEIEILFSKSQPVKHHPEGNAGTHTLMVLDKAREKSNDLKIIFAALCHDLGKGLTPDKILPRHIGHEPNGVLVVKALRAKFCFSDKLYRSAILVCEFHGLIHQVEILKPSTILKILLRINALKKPSNLHDLLLVCESDLQGRTGHEKDYYYQRDFWLQYLAALSDYDLNNQIKQAIATLQKDNLGKFNDRVKQTIYDIQLKAVQKLYSYNKHNESK